jgi:hypothetical protein
MTTRRLTYANVASTLALVLVLGGGGTAVAAGLAKNSVGSKQIKPAAVKSADLAPGAVDSVKIRDDGVTGTDVAESTLGKVPAATTADSATTAERAGNVHAAVVGDDGTLVPGQSLDAVSSTRLFTGAYEVIFDRNISGCAYVASIGEPGSTGGTAIGEISATGREDKPNGVFVKTAASNGTQTDKPFMVSVIC